MVVYFKIQTYFTLFRKVFQSKKTVLFENIGLLDIGDCFSKDQKFEFCLNVNVCVYQ